MTARGAINLLASAIQPVVPSGVVVAMGWPTETQLGGIANGSTLPIVSIYDRGVSRNRTRWNKVIMGTIEPLPPGVTSSISPTSGILPLGGVATLTLSGSVIVNDAVAAIFSYDLVREGQVVVAGPSDTLDTLAASLASVVNSDPILSAWVTAVASGATVQFTNITSGVVIAYTSSANQGQEVLEIRRILRNLQVILWVNNVADRDTISDPIVTLLSELSTAFGIQDVNNTNQWVRVIYNGDIYVDDAALNNLYRRDIITFLEYGETVTDSLYPVLVAKATYHNVD